MYVLSNTDTGRNHTFKTLIEVYNWIKPKITSSSLVDEINAMIEKEIARRSVPESVFLPVEEANVSHPADIVIKHSFTNANLDTNDICEEYIDVPYIADINEANRFKANIPFVRRIVSHFVNGLCETGLRNDFNSYKTHYLSGNVDSEPPKVTSECIKLWLKYYKIFNPTELSIDEDYIIKTYQDYLYYMILRRIPEGKCASSTTFTHMYNVYNYLTSHVFHLNNVNELTYTIVDLQYKCIESCTDSNVIELVKAWIKLYINNLTASSTQSSEIYSDIILTDILKFLVESPLNEWRPDSITSIVTHEFMMNYLTDLGIECVSEENGTKRLYKFKPTSTSTVVCNTFTPYNLDATYGPP